MRLFVFGLGYTGKAITAAFGEDGWTSVGSTGSEGTVTFDDDDGVATALAQATHVISTVAPWEGDPVLTRYGSLLEDHWLGYISSTGVYGDTAGAVVDESSPVQPRTDRARRRISAEEMTRVWCNERHVRRVVLRVPGIYGPERLPLERLRHCEPVVREREAGINNRIHVDDLVEACACAITNSEARGVYNVTDGRPLSSTTFINMVAKVAGLPAPPQVSMEEAQLTFSPERLSFLNESRRVSNERMLKHLGVVLKYADVEAGIRASLRVIPA